MGGASRAEWVHKQEESKEDAASLEPRGENVFGKRSGKCVSRR